MQYYLTVCRAVAVTAMVNCIAVSTTAGQGIRVDAMLLKITGQPEPRTVKFLNTISIVPVNIPPVSDVIVVPPNANLSGITKILESDGNLSELLAKNPLLRKSPDALQAGEVVKLANHTTYLTVHLKQKWASESGIANIDARLTDDPGVERDPRPVSNLHLVQPISEGQLASVDDECTSGNEMMDWTLIAQSIERLECNQAIKHRTVLGILDSGIRPDEKRFDLWENVNEVRGNDTSDDDGNGYFDDVHGASVLNVKAGPTPEGNDYVFNHGTHVAGIAAGASAPNKFKSVANFLRKSIEIMPVKITDSDGNITASAIHQGIIYALRYNNRDLTRHIVGDPRPARVINLSIDFPDVSEGYDTSLVAEAIDSASQQALFVAAAGNGNKDRQGFDVATGGLHAAMRSRDTRNVLVVTAVRSNKQLATFSNWNSTDVDLAAPGCSIESTTVAGTARYSGTSQAAPLVSFTAAILDACGLGSLSLIKERILLSTDYVDALDGKVNSAGVLNVAKALYLYHDVIQLDDDRLVTGDIETLLRVGDCLRATAPNDEVQPPPPGDIRRIRAKDSSRRFLVTGTPNYGVRDCQMSASIKVKIGSRSETIYSKNISSI